MQFVTNSLGLAFGLGLSAFGQLVSGFTGLFVASADRRSFAARFYFDA